MLPKPTELRGKSDEELIKMLSELRKDMINTSSDKPANVKNIKKVIARIKTILRERKTKI